MLKPSSAGARFRFAWTDTVPPKAPRFSASIVDGRVRVTWEDAVETGSGVAHYDVTVDGGAAVRFGADLDPGADRGRGEHCRGSTPSEWSRSTGPATGAVRPSAASKPSNANCKREKASNYVHMRTRLC